VRSGADRVEESAQEASECDGSERDANADEQIAGMLRAIHGAEVQESANVDGSAQSESVRAFAQLMIISHRRALAENQALFERLSIQPDEHALTRGLEAGHLRGLSAIDTRGAELDREYMRRQILEHRRSIELVDLMLPRAQNPEMRCALESTRHEAMTHLEMACWIWDSLQSERGTAGGERGARKSQRGRVVPFEGGRAGQQASVIEPSVDEDCDETSTGERTGGEEARKQPRRGIAEDP
jgi:predicted outer membrane protein